MVGFLTALKIQDNREHILCYGNGPDKNGKYAGWIEIDPRVVGRCTPLLSTEHIYETAVEAITAMEILLEAIYGIDLFAKSKPAPVRDCRV